MDRISALRNIEDALRDYEEGDLDLEALERRVATIVRTYGTAFETPEVAVYRARGGRADGTVVAAEDVETARAQVVDRFDTEDLEFELEQLG